jgi:nitrogen regulatory protein PII
VLHDDIDNDVSEDNNNGWESFADVDVVVVVTADRMAVEVIPRIVSRSKQNQSGKARVKNVKMVGIYRIRTQRDEASFSMCMMGWSIKESKWVIWSERPHYG